MRIAKWILGAVAGVLLLCVAAVVVVTSVIDPNRYRSKIEAIVADLAGRPFVIEGDLRITWFPWLGMRMGRAHLGNQTGNQSRGGPDRSGLAFIEWQSVAVRTRLVPLLQGQLVVDRVHLQGPHIRLHRDAQGHANWEGLGARSASPAGRQHGPPQIAGVEIRDGELEYVDDMSGVRLNLTSWQFDMGAWQPGRACPVHTRFQVHGGGLPSAVVWAQIDAPELTASVSPLFVAIPKLSLRLADAQLDGGLTMEAAMAHVRASGPVVAMIPSVRKLAADLALELPLPRDATTLGKLELTGTWEFIDGALTVKPLEMQVDDTKFAGWVSRSAAPAAQWLFELRGDHIDLWRYLDVDSANSKKPLELPVDALKALRANGSLVFDRARLANARMKDVRLRLQTAEQKP